MRQLSHHLRTGLACGSSPSPSDNSTDSSKFRAGSSSATREYPRAVLRARWRAGRVFCEGLGEVRVLQILILQATPLNLSSATASLASLASLAPPASPAPPVAAGLPSSRPPFAHDRADRLAHSATPPAALPQSRTEPTSAVGRN